MIGELNEKKLFLFFIIGVFLVTGCTNKNNKPVEVVTIEPTDEIIVSPEFPKHITVEGKEIKRESVKVMHVGDTLSDARLVPPTGKFETIDPIQFSSLKGWKVIHVVPSLDTPICSMQTKQLNAAAQEFSDIQFMTISADLPFAQRRFIIENKFEDMEVYSDYQGNEFAKKHGMYMPEYYLSLRAIMIVDEANEIQYIEYAEHVEKELNLHHAINFLRQNR